MADNDDYVNHAPRCPVLVRHPEHIMPSYRDWESRTQKARFDCAKAKRVLGWQPVADRAALVERGTAVPAREWLA